ncbi:wHTH domain-containing protein [Streptomyces termitum]|uniref:wHTH domain-containing protein n=1 Tax=Streptomyces termitum TaxID=67368 RepID=UPI0037B869E8
MTRFKALLVGASEYDDDGITSLPFVRDDLQRLTQALSARDFQPVEIVESPRGITTNVVNRSVRRFLQEAKRGDSLLVLVSGHGMHFEGRDYLIPEDASHEIEPFADSCVEIGWQKDLEECAADHVLFLVDACREGAERDTKAPGRKIGWTRRKIDAALRRKVAYLYACSAGQFARFVRETDTALPDSGVDIRTGESFSLFSRAVSDVVTGTTHQLDIAGFAAAVQERVSALHAAYGKKGQVQHVRIDTDVPHHQFPVLPGPPRGASVHPWVRAASRHPAWDLVPASPARDALQHVCATTAARLAEAYGEAAHAFRDNPWHDHELARRTLDRLGFLTKLGSGTALSASEAALLVLLPLVSQSFWAHEAAQRTHVLAAEATGEPASPEQQRFREFVRGFPRLKRRLRTLDQRGTADGSVERIRWWLYHRWLTRQPELYAPQTLKDLLGPLPEDIECPAWASTALAGDRFMRLLREMRAAPFAVPKGEQDVRELVVAATTPDEHVIREDLISALAKTAQALAVDPLELPEIVVEHIGISDSVGLPGLLATVRASDWRHSGMGRSLNALCDHPAVQIALREHARHTDSLLRAVNRSDYLTPLRALPPYADGDLVRLSGNTPARLADGIRFQLAEDRVQELLMGEQLYGKRDLAIRELYQNALDAVRHRDRRMEFLRRTRRPTAPWEGLIEFVQGVDEQERPYLECRDNGIGMGLDELSKVFSQGGTRFVDLPEYIEEQSAWAELGEPRIELSPNSRFGIGVLSYFMLADEIEVRTCRMGLDGRPGRLLQVRIAGPGNLFRIDDLGEGTEPGTRVKLLLADHQDRVSCVEALQSVLWLAPYRTTADHGFRHHEWLPGVLSPEGHEDKLERRSHTQNPSSFHSSDSPEVWWTDGVGWILADGLYAEAPYGEDPYGAVVNLTGSRQPELSIDRNTMRAVDTDQVRSIVHRAIPSLFTSARGILTPLWLDNLAWYSVALADTVVEEAASAEFPWPMGAADLPIGSIGAFGPDTVLRPLADGDYDDVPSPHLASLLRSMPEHVLRWRLRTLHAAGLGAPLVPGVEHPLDRPMARPSDLVFLLNESHQSARWAWRRDSWLAGPESGNYLNSTPSPACRSTGVTSLALLPLWRDAGKTVSPDDLFELVRVTGYPAGEIAERMRALGFTVAPLNGSEAVGPADLALLQERHRDSLYWSPGATLRLPHVFLSALRAEVPLRQAAERLGELGFTVPHDIPDDPLSSDEKAILGEYLDGIVSSPAPLDHSVVSMPALVAAACGAGATVREAAAVFERAGFALPCERETLPELTDADEILLRQRSTPLPPYPPVPLVHLRFAAGLMGGTEEEAAARLCELGFSVPELNEGPPPFSKSDFAFLGSVVFLREYTGWPHEQVPIDAYGVVNFARRWAFTMAQTRERLTSLGYNCSQSTLFDEFTVSDLENVYFVLSAPRYLPSLVAPAVDAIAEHVGRPPEDIAEHLAAFGYTVEDPTPEWLAERAAEQVLLAAFADDDPPPGEPPVSVGLPVLAAVAARLRLPFRTVADRATVLGLRHEAADWFAPG